MPVGLAAPAIHIDVQVHIPADATPEAYEAIFTALAKHLLGRPSD
jgi:hypothetical protein